MASVITADNSRNQTLAFDGLLTDGFNPATASFVQALPNGTAGTGTFLFLGSVAGQIAKIKGCRAALPNCGARNGQGQTVLREALLVADHNAYHLGQLITIRWLLGAWHDEA